MTTLYERWRQVAASRGRELALVDMAAGKRWTFAELARAAEASPKPAGRVVCPQGHHPEFIFKVLQGWRHGVTVCPLEAGQGEPHFEQLPRQCAHLKSTSASTGAARWVAFGGDELAADPAAIVATMGLRAEWANVAAISLAHSYGFSNLVLPLLLHGIPLVLAESGLPQAVRNACRAAEWVTLAGVPTLWRAWQDAGALPENIRLAISAGAPLPLALEQTLFERAGLKVHNFYGASECGGIAYDASPEPRRDGACVGQPMAHVKLTLSDAGCLRIRSPGVARGYWPDPGPEVRRSVFQTSDLAELKEGQVYLRGRLSDQMNIAGRKVLPEPIEQALRAHPAVQECLVFSVADSERSRGEMIVACVQAKEKVTAATLRSFLLHRVPAWQVPRGWHFVERLHAGARGKLSRAEWKNHFLQNHKSH